MGQVLQFGKPAPVPHFRHYLDGATLLVAARDSGRMPLLDSAGKPVRAGELYEVTPTTIRRIA